MLRPEKYQELEDLVPTQPGISQTSDDHILHKKIQAQQVTITSCTRKYKSNKWWSHLAQGNISQTNDDHILHKEI